MSEQSRTALPIPGQTWDDHGVTCTVVSVAEDGRAIVRLATGERLPVQASFFERARLVDPRGLS